MKGMISSVLEEKLYRILTDKGEWAFYNDSLYYQVHVTYELSKESTITPGPISKITVQQNGAMEVSLVLYPEETAILFSGTVKNFENKSKAILLPATYQSPSNVLVETQEKRRLNIKLEAKNAGLEELSTEQAVQLCVQQNLPFVDEQFPPDVTSLFRDKVDSVVPPLLWRTFRDYLPSEAHAQARLFCGDITPFRVEMGKGLENTNIISAIQIAAEFPEVIRRLFLHPDGAKAGKLERAFNAFRVQLCKNGWWTNVVVDGYVPAAAHCPEFARIKDDLRCLWLPFLEKSLAKLYGSYSALLVAPSETGLSNLTGTPHTPLTSFWPKQATNAAEVQKLAQLIQRQFANGGQLMLTAFPLSTANTKEKKDRLEAAYKQLGLVPGFSVCVLGVHEIAGTLLVRIRENGSPDCGKRNWLKVWYGAKKPWVDDVEKEIFARGEEGVLWMEIGDLPQYFKGGFFFYPQLNDWSTVRVQGVLTEGVPSVCMKVSVKEKLQGVLCVTQPDLLSTSSVFSTDNLEDMLADETVAPIGLHIFGKKGRHRGEYVDKREQQSRYI
ncbi:calpain-like cysteine peptidase [Angomonas deanei]|nr:calpain-like cysteine peptidase [Angomonas deanei]|eukprot:EPY36766.1 calpain-like cysteine peptidase [Angomonas deanei]